MASFVEFNVGKVKFRVNMIARCGIQRQASKSGRWRYVSNFDKFPEALKYRANCFSLKRNGKKKTTKRVKKPIAEKKQPKPKVKQSRVKHGKRQKKPKKEVRVSPVPKRKAHKEVKCIEKKLIHNFFERFMKPVIIQEGKAFLVSGNKKRTAFRKEAINRVNSELALLGCSNTVHPFHYRMLIFAWTRKLLGINK